MGFLRLLLALSVVFSHLSGAPTLIGGWRAVQVFYFISGFYMALILDGKYHSASYKTFLGNRLLRLLPLYYISILLIGIRWLHSYLNNVPCKVFFPHCGVIHWADLKTPIFLAFTQLALIGQDWLFFLRITPEGSFALTTTGLSVPLPGYVYNINPVSWTLGIELMFYLIAPLLLRRKTRLLCAVLFISLMLRGYLYFGMKLDYIPWTYRFFPLELAVFLAGSVAYRFYKSSFFLKLLESKVPFIGLGYLGVISTLFFPYLEPRMEYATLFYYGLIILSVPFLFHLTRQSVMDRNIGELSYPVYLLHLPICDLTQRLLTKNIAVSILSLILVSYILICLVVRPIDKLREKRLKNNPSAPHNKVELAAELNQLSEI